MIRIIYIIISFAIIVISYYAFPHFTANSDRITLFSYIGTVSTIVALLIALSEIWHSIRTTKSIQEKSLELLTDVQKIESASSFSDCLAAIDLVTMSISNDQYEIATNHFQHLRKICAKVIPGFGETEDNSNPSLNSLSSVELDLHKAKKTSPSAPLSKPQKHKLLKDILLIKQQIESLNPAKRT